MKNLLIFAISSDLPQEGKSTAAKAINDNPCFLIGNGIWVNPKVKIFSFADALKKEVCKIFNLDINRMLNDEEYKCQHRDLLRKHGQDERSKNKDVWVEKVCNQIDNELSDEYLTIVSIPDLRFQNELHYLIKKYGKESVIHIHVTVSDIVMMKRKGWSYDSEQFIDWLDLKNDESEKDFYIGSTICVDFIDGAIYPDYIISNNRSKDAFENQIITIARSEIMNRYI